MKHREKQSETEPFEQFLQKAGLAENTRRAYRWSVTYFKKQFDSFSHDNLLAYKERLQLHCKPATVNLRLQGINKYLEFTGNEQLRLRFVREQQKKFLENVISNADYQFLKAQLKAVGNLRWYFLVWFMAATGARVSEVIQIKVEHVQLGSLDLYSKGGKMRRLYIPSCLRSEALRWLSEMNRTSGYLFLNRYGKRISPRGIAAQLKAFAERYGIDRRVMHPHSFRHRFAINFLERHNDIALLADLMGHESIETTRIYLRKTAAEQQSLVDSVVRW